MLPALKDFGFGSLGLKEADFTGDDVVQLGYPPNRVDLLSGISGVATAKVWKTRVKGTYQGLPARLRKRKNRKRRGMRFRFFIGQVQETGGAVYIEDRTFRVSFELA